LWPQDSNWWPQENNSWSGQDSEDTNSKESFISKFQLVLILYIIIDQILSREM